MAVLRPALSVEFVRRVLLCTTAAATCLSAAPASAQQAITTPILTSLENFRDLAGIAAEVNGVPTGGTGLVNTTSHGGVARTGVFYRSQELYNVQTNAVEWALISNLNIRNVIDLRTPAEWDPAYTPPPPTPATPDPYIGATEIHINIFGSGAPPSPAAITTSSEALTYMRATYEGFVSDATQRAHFREVLLTLANAPDAALYHCSAGKDRTGWTSMLLQTIAGVPMETIVKDYLASNIYLKAMIDAQVNAASTPDQKLMASYLYGVDPRFLDAGLAQVASQYGSLEAYLTQGLGLTQEDIYVLRGKMVYYGSLPGQAGFVGNAASGAAFLNALQNSPLSGRYTRYNYYLQSAIDAGTLGGVESQAGGQVHADAAAYVSRRPAWIEDASAAYTSGRDLGVGRTRLWATGMGDYFNTGGATGIARSTERTAGTVAGGTYRLGPEISAHFGLGYSSGSVTSANASANVEIALATFGARYGLTSLENGYYVAARGHLGWIDYGSERNLGGGLGIARGNTHGALYSGRVDIGQIVRVEGYTLTPQVGLRASRVVIGGFAESGSELALSMSDITHTAYNLVTDVDAAMEARHWAGWTVVPSATLGYEFALRDPQAWNSGTLYGFSVAQASAYDSRHLLKAGLAVMAQRAAFSVKAAVNGALGEGSSAGVNAQVALAYRF
jgi:protein tyrosine/serine phosphatase